MVAQITELNSTAVAGNRVEEKPFYLSDLQT